MALKPGIWLSIAVLFGLGNLVALLVAARTIPPDPLHLAIHVVLIAGAAAWAYRLRVRQRAASRQIAPETADALDLLEAAEAEAQELRRQLAEAQERLDFSERIRAPSPGQRRQEDGS